MRACVCVCVRDGREADEHSTGGYAPWVPFDHPQLGRVEVGGPDHMRVWDNPPAGERLRNEVAPHADFTVWQVLPPHLPPSPLLTTPLAPRAELTVLPLQSDSGVKGSRLQVSSWEYAPVGPPVAALEHSGGTRQAVNQVLPQTVATRGAVASAAACVLGLWPVEAPSCRTGRPPSKLVLPKWAARLDRWPNRLLCEDRWRGGRGIRLRDETCAALWLRAV